MKMVMSVSVQGTDNCKAEHIKEDQSDLLQGNLQLRSNIVKTDEENQNIHKTKTLQRAKFWYIHA